MEKRLDFKKNKNSGLKKDKEGNLFLEGSGKFFMNQKDRYSKYDKPYEQLYTDQVNKALQNSSEEVRTLFSVI